MKNKKYIMALDQSTTSSKTIIIDKKGNVVSWSQKPFKQIHPYSGWSEHDAKEIWETQLATIKDAKKKAKINFDEIAGLGITNQRHTVVVWDKTNGIPIYNAIVWEDTRTHDICESLKKRGFGEKVTKKTGLMIHPMPTATSLKWILDNVEKAKNLLKKGNLLAGTIDTWLIWKLTKGKVFATDVSNASRTLLFNIHTLTWDDELLELFGIPKSILPEVKPSSCFYGNIDPQILSNETKELIPITGVIADQQGALFGQLAWEKGDTKNSYGTSNGILTNIGTKPLFSKNGILTEVAWKIGDQPAFYALEGNFLVSGSAIQWMQDELGFIKNGNELDSLVQKVKENDGQKIYFVPALTGLGAPEWDPTARGAIFGLERGTTKAHIVRACLESIAYNSEVLINLMNKVLKKPIEKVKVDGGICQSNFLMQFQSDISQTKIIIPHNQQLASTGAALLSGLAIGFWSSMEEIKNLKAFKDVDKIFIPKISKDVVNKKLKGWKDAVSRVQNWID